MIPFPPVFFSVTPIRPISWTRGQAHAMDLFMQFSAVAFLGYHEGLQRWRERLVRAEIFKLILSVAPLSEKNMLSFSLGNLQEK